MSSTARPFLFLVLCCAFGSLAHWLIGSLTHWHIEYFLVPKKLPDFLVPKKSPHKLLDRAGELVLVGGFAGNSDIPVARPQRLFQKQRTLPLAHLREKCQQVIVLATAQPQMDVHLDDLGGEKRAAASQLLLR